MPIPHCWMHLLALLPIQVKRLQTHTMQSSVCLPRRKTSLLSPLRQWGCWGCWRGGGSLLWTNSHSLSLVLHRQSPPSPGTWQLICVPLTQSPLVTETIQSPVPFLFCSLILLRITNTCIIQIKEEFGSQSVTQSLQSNANGRCLLADPKCRNNTEAGGIT